MALAPYKTWAAGEILTASDLNASFAHITSNGLAIAFPATAAVDLDGQTLILDSDSDSTFRASADDVVTLTLNGFGAFIWDGDVASPVNGITFTSAATGTSPAIAAHGTDTDIGLLVRGKGAGKVALGALPLLFPNVDGTVGQVLSTNGSGVLGWNSIAAVFASADRIAFQQTTPSAAWVKDTTITSDSAVRLITGSVANDLTGSAFSTIFASARATGTNSVGHTHSVSVSGTTGSSGTVASISGAAGTPFAGDHTHSFSASTTSGGVSANHTHTTDMKVDYYDFTIGEYV